jgi:hypothetical protein
MRYNRPYNVVQNKAPIVIRGFDFALDAVNNNLAAIQGLEIQIRFRRNLNLDIRAAGASEIARADLHNIVFFFNRQTAAV